MTEERPPEAAPHTPSDDPRVDILAAALRDLAPAWTEERGVRWRSFATDILARLDAAAPAPGRNAHGDVDLIDEAWSLLTSEPRDDAWEAARDRWGIRYGQAEPPRGGLNRARLLEEMWRRRSAGARDAEPQFDWQAAEEGFVPCARGQRCELQLVRPGKVQCDCDTPGTDAAVARAEAESAPAARDDALDRVTAALPDPEGVEHDGAMHWRVHDYTGDDEYGAEGETWTVQLDVAGVVHLDGNPIAPATDLVLAVLAAARCRDRLGATTNIMPEEG